MLQPRNALADIPKPLSNSPINPNEIFSGFWIDYSYGKGTGLSLTVSTASSVYLIAFLALFVRTAGNHLWNLICYAVFRLRSTSSGDGLFHQQQILLRSGLSDTKTALVALELTLAWRKKVPRAIRRSAFLVVIAFVHVFLFAICGIFSSRYVARSEAEALFCSHNAMIVNHLPPTDGVARVAQTHSNVLLRDRGCGQPNLPGLTQGAINGSYTPSSITASGVEDWAAISGALQADAANYVQQCYPFPQTFASPSCQAYGRRSLTWTIDDSIPCPFDSQICIDDLAVRFNTSWIDSSEDLGINAPPEHRVQVQLVGQNAFEAHLCLTYTRSWTVHRLSLLGSCLIRKTSPRQDSLNPWTDQSSPTKAFICIITVAQNSRDGSLGVRTCTVMLLGELVTLQTFSPCNLMLSCECFALDFPLTWQLVQNYLPSECHISDCSILTLFTATFKAHLNSLPFQSLDHPLEKLAFCFS